MYDGLGAVIGEETNSTVDGTTQETFVVDALGNRTRRRQLLNDDGGGDDFQHQRLFEYDGSGKMLRVTTPNGLLHNFMHTEDYGYDPAGNTTLVHILETKDGDPPDHVSHASYYSADNKLRVFNKRIGIGSASNDAVAGKRGTFDEYRYDALGRKVFARSRKLGGNCPTAQADCAPTATRTVWDGDHILYEVRAPGGEIVSGTDTIPDPGIESDNPNGGPNGLAYGVVGYTYGLNIDEPLTIVRMGSTHYGIYDPTVVFPHTDWRGMLALVTDTAGRRIVCPISGNICIPIDLPGGNATVDRGKKVEVEPLSWFGSLASSGAEQSGLQYKRNRFYDPKRGQFTQADPIGLGAGTNLYGFASGDAVNFDDPFGLCPPIEDCLQRIANWGARKRGRVGSIALNGAAALNAVNDFNPITTVFDAGFDIGSGHPGRGLATAMILAVPGGRGAGAVVRTEARTLAEQLTLEEAKAGAGTEVMRGKVKDATRAGWAKMQHIHTNPDGTKIVVHYWREIESGMQEGFKFKNE